MSRIIDLKQAVEAKHKQSITLRFVDDGVEAEYNTFIYWRILPILKIATILAIFVHPLFGVVDYVSMPDHKVLWIIRFGIGMPIIVFVAYCTCFEIYKEHHQKFGVITVLSLVFSIILMIYFGNYYVASHYYSGLYITIFFASILFYVRFVYMIGIVSASILMFSIVTLYFQELTYQDFTVSIIFLTVSLSLCLIASYIVEYSLRQLYLKNKIEQALFESEASNKAKTDFLTVMSHELRSPLVSVQGFADILLHKQKIQDDPVLYGATQEIFDNARHLNTVISDILEYAKASSGKMTLKLEEIPLLAVVEESVRMLTPQFTERSIAVVVTVLPDITLYSDRQLTKQMLINLLSNAMKYSHEQTTITVSASATAASTCVAIADEGIGIAAENLEKVLEPFVQVEDAFVREQASTSTGIGLPFVKKVIELHGGQLSLESVLGAGTTVRLFFPKQVG